MMKRHKAYLRPRLPVIDFNDCGTKRRFAPEYSHQAYLTMMKADGPVGNYLKMNSSLGLEPRKRKGMVTMMKDLQKFKSFKLETFYLATSIADHYLMVLATRSEAAPNMIYLGVVSLIIAIKLEEPIVPRLSKIIMLLMERHKITIEKEKLVKLEQKVLIDLDFNIRYTSPISFLERFQRAFEVDREEDERACRIGELARKFCLKMVMSQNFLEFSPA